MIIRKRTNFKTKKRNEIQCFNKTWLPWKEEEVVVKLILIGKKNLANLQLRPRFAPLKQRFRERERERNQRNVVNINDLLRFHWMMWYIEVRKWSIHSGFSIHFIHNDLSGSICRRRPVYEHVIVWCVCLQMAKFSQEQVTIM